MFVVSSVPFTKAPKGSANGKFADVFRLPNFWEYTGTSNSFKCDGKNELLDMIIPFVVEELCNGIEPTKIILEDKY